MDVAAAAAALDAELRASGTAQRAEQERAYLKSDLEHYGASVPAVRRCAKAALAGAGAVGHDELVALADELWSVPVFDRRMAVVELLDLAQDRLGPDDLPRLEGYLRGSQTWALVDSLAASVVGGVVERAPAAAAATLDRWAADDDFWIRRSALLALLIPLRRGEGDWDRFARYADAMLDEEEFFIRKAIGWVLRDTAKKRPDLVFAWLLPRARRLSTVTRREALKPLSPAQREMITGT